MTDINKKFEFPERLRVVYEDARARLKPHDDREGTFTGFPDDGKTPFEDAFKKYADEPYIIKLAHGIVDSWLMSEPRIFPREMIIGFPRPLRPVYEHFSSGISVWCVKDEKKGGGCRT